VAQVREAISAILEHGGGGRPESVQEFARAIGRTKKSIADESAALSKRPYNRDALGRFVTGRQSPRSDPRLQVLRQDAAVRAIEGAVLDAAQRAPGGEGITEFLKTTGIGEMGAHTLGVPPGVITGLKLGEQFYRWLRSPNRAVAQLFERAAQPAPKAAPLAPVLPQDRDKLPDLSALDPRLLGMLALGGQ
jgi:hypothetical protein